MRTLVQKFSFRTRLEINALPVIKKHCYRLLYLKTKSFCKKKHVDNQRKRMEKNKYDDHELE